VIFFYSLAVLPILIGLVLWGKNKKVIWWEWIVGSVIALLMACGFHWIALEAQCRDHETFSGRMIYATHHPYWQSRELVHEYRTDGDGNRVYVGSHYEYEDHDEYWDCNADFGTYIGEQKFRISVEFFTEISSNFCHSKLDIETPFKPDFYSGDQNIYIARNHTDFWYPMTTSIAFRNRVKASPSLYTYAPVPKDAKVFPYPQNNDPFKSERLLGTAFQTITLKDFDILCGKLGPIKKVNIIMIGFGDMDSEISHLQEAAWVGGKKNDLVICYGGSDPLKPAWAYCFGWTESTLVKANLQTIILQNPIDNSIIPKLYTEIGKNYKIKDWDKFSYLQVDPPPWSYWVYVLAMILVQGCFWCWASMNEFVKYNASYRTGYRTVFGRKTLLFKRRKW
jgi:hypothetical protein